MVRITVGAQMPQFHSEASPYGDESYLMPMTITEWVVTIGFGIIGAAITIGLMAFIGLIIEGAFHR